MKVYRSAIVLIAILILSGCDNPPAEKEGRFIRRDDRLYERGAEKPFAGIVTEEHATGEKKRETEYRAGKLDGRIIRWYKNGKKSDEIEYRDGLKHGKAILWYEDGTKMSEIEWRNGRTHGKMTTWYEENEQKEQEGFNQEGELHGKLLWWYENGQKMAETEYHHGEVISMKKWDEAGNPME